MRTLGVIAIATLLVGVAGCLETRTLPRDETRREDAVRAKTSAESSPPAPAAFPPHEPRPVLNR